MSGFVDVQGRDINDSPANSLSGSTFGSISFQDGPFQVGGTDNQANGSQSAAPVGATSGLGSLGGGFNLSLPEMLLLAGAVIFGVYYLHHHHG